MIINKIAMGTRAVAVGASPGAAGVSGEAGLAGVPRLLEDLARLSEDKDTADIVFLLGRDETLVYAHRIILQARSVSTGSNCSVHRNISSRPRINYIYHTKNVFPPRATAIKRTILFSLRIDIPPPRPAGRRRRKNNKRSRKCY